MPEDFVSNAGDIFSDMRLLIEGAIVLFENDASSIMHLTRGKEHYRAQYAFNTIGAALYQLREYKNKHSYSITEFSSAKRAEKGAKTADFRQ